MCTLLCFSELRVAARVVVVRLSRRVCMTLWGCGLCLLPLGAIDIDPRGQLNNHESFPLSTYSGLHWRVVAMKARPFSRAANGCRLIKELHSSWPKVICLSDLRNWYSFFQVFCKWLNLFFQQGLKIIKIKIRWAFGCTLFYQIYIKKSMTRWPSNWVCVAPSDLLQILP